MSTEVERGLGLEREGIETTSVKWNLSAAALYEEALRQEEVVLAANGPLACRTGQHTGRSPNDKFVVREASSEAQIAWGKVNRPMDAAHFDALHRELLGSLKGKRLYVLDCFAGADPVDVGAAASCSVWATGGGDCGWGGAPTFLMSAPHFTQKGPLRGTPHLTQKVAMVNPPCVCTT